jgi:hypothetical protein
MEVMVAMVATEATVILVATDTAVIMDIIKNYH